MSQKQTEKVREAAKTLVSKFFKNDEGEPFLLTDGQADIFNCIWTKRFPRNQIVAATQYGKSEVVAMALLLRTTTFGEKFAIISGQMDKAMIIMSKVIQHAFDHKHFISLLELDQNMPLDRLKRERTRDSLTFKGGGAIKAFTANSKNRQAVREALTGFGSPNIVEDEASLVPDDVQAMILRMLGGHKEQFLLKIGNPFYRNHFHRTWKSNKYNRIFIDYHQALREGRYSEDFIEEMSVEPFFDVLYECKFPDRNDLLTDGYKALIPEDLLENAYITLEEAQSKGLFTGRIRLGGDFAGGGSDRTAYIARWPKVAMLLSTNKNKDTMTQVPIIENYIKEYKIEHSDVGLDYGGLGQGVSDRLIEKDVNVNPVLFGEGAPDGERKKYLNMRAYMYYRLLRWLKKGGKLIKCDGFNELLSVNYKSDSERKLQIQSKEQLKKIMKELGIKASSPDIADALVLTFANNSKMVTEDDFGFA